MIFLIVNNAMNRHYGQPFREEVVLTTLFADVFDPAYMILVSY